jgi:hypothetical protein
MEIPDIAARRFDRNGQMVPITAGNVAVFPMVILMALGCLERVTGEEVPLDSRFTAQPSHSNSMGDDTAAPAHSEQVHNDVAHEEAAPPQPFEDAEGERITLSGVLVSKFEGPVDLDVSTVDKNAPGGLKSEGKLIFDGPGPFSFDVPVGVGEILVAGFQDLESDGPSEADPYAEVRVDVLNTSILDIELAMIPGGRATATKGPEHKEVPPPQPFVGIQGERVVLSGTIISEAQGPVDLDVSIVDSEAEGGLDNQGKLIVEAPGPYSLEVPVDIGTLQLAAFQDLEKDGPSANDPYAELRVQVETVAIDQVDFTLVTGGRNTGGAVGPEHVEAPPGFGSGQAPPPDGTPTQSDLFAGYEGPRVKVSGLLVWDGEGVVDMDLFTPDSSASGGRKLLGKLKKNVGAFSITVPLSLGQLEIDAFADRTGDGPSGDDPRATIGGITLTEGKVSDLQVVLVSLVEDAPPPPPEGGGTDLEEEFARTVGGSGSKKQTGDGP